ncbi:MAG: apolipoprotein N-acyltransferase [Acidobacteria bacterium]|nr:apolipoprotein N-acyltransferase [Acidobacteriota bacterium]
MLSAEDSRSETVELRGLFSGRREMLLGLGAATLSGTMLFLACPKFDLWLLAWIAVVPLLFVMVHASTMRRAIFFAWWTAVIGNAGGFYWLIATIERFGSLPFIVAFLLFLVFCAYQALRFLLFGWAVRSIRQRTNLPLSLLAPVVMASCELLVPFIFPYYLALTQSWHPVVIQLAEFTGPLGITALLFMANGAVADLIIEGRRRRFSAIASAVILVFVVGYGYVRTNRIANARASAPKLRVGIVQPNVANDQAEERSYLKAPRTLTEIQQRSAELEQAGAELIIWPETGYATPLSRRVGEDLPPYHPQRIRTGFTTPLILGVVTYDESFTEESRQYNTALLLDREGKFTGRYDKNSLLAFGEYVPGTETFPSIKQLSPVASRFTPGADVAVFSFQATDGREWRIGPLICLEDIIPSLGRKLAARHPHLLVNVTDDSWFGDTSEPWQHLALSVFRTVELRTEMVRAVNPGVSAYIDATGRVYAKTYALDPTTDHRGADKLLAEVALIEGGHTVYSAVGDVFGYACVASTLFLWLILPRLGERMRRRRASA